MKLFITWSLIIIADITCTVSLCQTSGQSAVVSSHQKLARDIFAELTEINTTVNMGSIKDWNSCTG